MAEAPHATVRAIRIEGATSGDAHALAALAAEAAVPGWSEASLASSIDDAGAIAFQARGNGGAPLGFVLARAVADEVEVLLVAVAPTARRRGLARALLERAFARAARARFAHLEVRVSNAPAIALYESMGFVAIGRRPRYYEGGEDALSMRCRLGGPTG